MKKYSIENLPQQISVIGNFDSSCEVSISPEALSAIEHGRLKVRINKHGGKPVISNFYCSIGSLSGNIVIFVGNDDSTVNLENGTSGAYDFRLWRSSKITIGKRTTSNGVRVVCDNSEFICGEDCMFSDTILIQTADQHGIVDIAKGLIINDDFKSVILGDHVWLGRQCTLTAKARVGNGSVIGTGSVVTGNIPNKVIAAGIPARIIKENHTWCRSPVSLDYFSSLYVDENC
jgi:acetyltransferase-like isoleucine patch superfamily enzyme